MQENDQSSDRVNSPFFLIKHFLKITLDIHAVLTTTSFFLFLFSFLLILLSAFFFLLFFPGSPFYCLSFSLCKSIATTHWPLISKFEEELIFLYPFPESDSAPSRRSRCRPPIRDISLTSSLGRYVPAPRNSRILEFKSTGSD